MKMHLKNFIPMACVFPAIVFGQMIADITEDTQTEFGVYRPYRAEFTPKVPTYSIKADFSNVSNFNKFGNGFTAADSARIVKNHFTVTRSVYKQLYDVYNSCTWDGTPIFITTDAVLHIYHVLFDRLLAEIEVRSFFSDLDQLNQALIIQAQTDLAKTSGTLSREAVRRNLAFLCVAQKLLKGNAFSAPPNVSALVDSELVLVGNHSGFEFSPIFGNFSKLDYSQFVPRGHYTRNDSLKAYFKAMIWYGWTIFTMEPQLFGNLARRHTLQALHLTRMVYTAKSGSETVSDLWEKLYQPTVFFVGRTDDPDFTDYKALAEQIFGHGFLSFTTDALADTALLDAFMVQAQKLPPPQIPNWIYGEPTPYKGFRFMGQRIIPDSYLFAHLVDPYVPGRNFPRGLDVFSIIGSELAGTLSDSLYHEAACANYSKQIKAFQSEFATKPADDWAQNLYWNWLYCLMPLVYQKGAGYPPFMQTRAWADKELFTALASWAELRHDAILYAKQSMTPMGIAPGPPKSYVEPNPHLYARLASLAKYTREGLHAFRLPIERFQKKLDLFEKFLLFLRDVSIKELENVPLSDQEYKNIFCFGRVMQELVSETQNPQNPSKYDTDDMAVVADVHTDANSNRCLEEGVGYPLEIFVIVNEGGILRLTRGAVFSYYEFTQPISNRLTDEKWRILLTGNTPPEMPEWTGSFMNSSVKPVQYETTSPKNLYYHEFSSVETEADNRVPVGVLLHRNYPNPFNPRTRISFDLPRRVHAVLRIFNPLGQEVAILFDRELEAGRYDWTWNGEGKAGEPLPSGIYLYRLETPESMLTGKMALMR